MNACSLLPTELIIDARWLALTFLFLWLALGAALAPVITALVEWADFDPWP